MKLRVLDLFSGIGGFSLGLERAGMRTVAMCEIDPYCRAVLKRHWPGVPIYDDIRTLTAARLAADGIIQAADVADAPKLRCNGHQAITGSPGAGEDHRRLQQPAGSGIDLVCGGFPCQDISSAGKRAGIDGERSGLWAEMARVIGEVRPRWVVVENVSALLARGLGRVIGDLDALGYVGEWHCIPAAAVGAPHRRDRVWIVAYPQHPDADGAGSYRAAMHVNGSHESADQQVDDLGSLGKGSAHANGQGEHAGALHAEMGGAQEPVADAGQPGLAPSERETLFGAGRWDEGRAIAECGWWLVEPDVGRMANGVPARVDRLRSLGNAVVPQVVEVIGRAIVGAQ